MEELLNILKDIKSGALPLSEIPGFLAWTFRRTIWFWISVALVLVLWLVR